MKRGAINTKDSTFIGFWIQKPLLRLIDQGVVQADSDRSKFLRAAVREKLSRRAATNGKAAK